MLSNKNSFILACAGSRKTTQIVEDALASKTRILITTYTNENLDQIRAYLVEKAGAIPANITVLSWFSFLLSDGVRPYQNYVIDGGRIRGIHFDPVPKALQYVKKTNTAIYYTTKHRDIYKDRVSDFVCKCDEASGGLVVRRISKVYSRIYIDELQDLAGYDLEFLDKLLCSASHILAVGDPRQATFSTNNSTKNKKYKKDGIFDWILEKRSNGILEVQNRNECYRSNQSICDFADALFPNMPKSMSKNQVRTDHDGIFKIAANKVCNYVSTYKPVVLR